jgi:8-oxo-dGTP pyrophosphatase MutT (NUDIX family)
MTVTPSVENIASLLKSHAAAPLPASDAVRAAVAMILRDSPRGPQVLFVERATFAGDPWSGNIGFPGGKVIDGDGDARLTAERETMEEVGIDLTRCRYLGFLAEIAGAHLPVRVSCFIYLIPNDCVISLNDEIVDAFWVGLDQLTDSGRHCLVPIPFEGEEVPRPGIRLPQAGKPFLWGLTYRLVMELLYLLPTAAAGTVMEPGAAG